jgi:hypothetical protein
VKASFRQNGKLKNHDVLLLFSALPRFCEGELVGRIKGTVHFALRLPKPLIVSRLKCKMKYALSFKTWFFCVLQFRDRQYNDKGKCKKDINLNYMVTVDLENLKATNKVIKLTR